MEEHFQEPRDRFPISTRQQFAEKLNVILHHVERFPEDIPHIGIASAKNNAIFVNTTLLGKFLGVKRNSVNHNLRRMGYELVLDKPSNELLAQLPKVSVWPRTWSKRVYKRQEIRGVEQKVPERSLEDFPNGSNPTGNEAQVPFPLISPGIGPSPLENCIHLELKCIVESNK
jgi:hypothetical protein